MLFGPATLQSCLDGGYLPARIACGGLGVAQRFPASGFLGQGDLSLAIWGYAPQQPSLRLDAMAGLIIDDVYDGQIVDIGYERQRVVNHSRAVALSYRTKQTHRSTPNSEHYQFILQAEPNQQDA